MGDKKILSILGLGKKENSVPPLPVDPLDEVLCGIQDLTETDRGIPFEAHEKLRWTTPTSLGQPPYGYALRADGYYVCGEALSESPIRHYLSTPPLSNLTDGTESLVSIYPTAFDHQSGNHHWLVDPPAGGVATFVRLPTTARKGTRVNITAGPNTDRASPVVITWDEGAHHYHTALPGHEGWLNHSADSVALISKGSGWVMEGPEAKSIAGQIPPTDAHRPEYKNSEAINRCKSRLAPHVAELREALTVLTREFNTGAGDALCVELHCAATELLYELMPLGLADEPDEPDGP